MYRPNIQAGCIVTYIGITLKILDRVKSSITCKVLPSGELITLYVSQGMEVITPTDVSIEVI